MTDASSPKPAFVRKRPSEWRFSGIWLVPFVAALIALYLAWMSYSERGPVITVSFNTADGIVAGQTQLKYKAVSLGTVVSVRLNPKTQRVEVRARMVKDAEHYLTDRTRFWVVRPRFSSGSISGFETLISGAYIQCDPGTPGGEEKTGFEGLEDAPGVRSDEPGKTYVLKADRLGSVNVGSTIYFRDVAVGEVLNHDIGDGFGPIKLTVFVRSPYDKIIRPGTRFWNASGFSVNVGAEGLHVELQSLQSVIGGGIDFETPEDARKSPPSEEHALFPLYASQEAAETSTIHERIPFVTYFQTSVKNLGAGSAVTMYGIRIGTVTDVKLLVDPDTANVNVRVAYEVEPERTFTQDNVPSDPVGLTRKLVQKGVRAKLASDNLITGQKSVAFEFVPRAKPVELTMEDKAIVMPAGPVGGLDGITDALADVTSKLDQIPFAQIGEHLSNLLAHVDQATAGPDLQNAVHALSVTLNKTQALVEKADQGLSPALAKLPQISAELQATAAHANSALSSLDQQSDFQRDAKRTLDQVGDAARSLRLLADFLNRHPEALLRGRDNKETK